MSDRPPFADYHQYVRTMHCGGCGETLARHHAEGTQLICPAPSRDPLRDAADGLKALLPQMREDVECHRSWTTAAAKADIEKIGARWVGDVEWHERWAAYYGKVVAAMESAIEQLERAALAPRSEGERTE